ncbi:MAG: hypothetical protein JXR96_09985 [Deltaproteobacteria bacterium]|nr:hypothetical protein [Deltaproteobacteria bacterium]
MRRKILIVAFLLAATASRAPARHKDPPRARPQIALVARDADIHALARLVCDVAHQNLVVPGTVQGRVSLRAVKAPWDRVLGMALREAGSAFRFHGSFLVVGEPGELEANRKALRRARRHAEEILGPRSARARAIPLGKRVSLDFTRAELENLLPLFADIQKADLRPEQGLAARVSVMARNVPWRHALEAVLLACGMGMQKAEEGIRVGRFEALQRGDAKRFGPLIRPELPDVDRSPPTARFALKDYKLVAVVSGIQRPRALVEDTQGRCFVLCKGSRLGKDHARVAEILPEAMKVEQESRDATGARQVERYRLDMGSAARLDPDAR